MKFFEQAKENYRKNNYYKSLELFELSLSTEPLTKDLKIQCCEKIEKINLILKRETSVELLKFLSSVYFDLGHFSKAANFFNKLFKETGDESYLRYYFLCVKDCGEVAESKKSARRYLAFLIKLKLPNMVLSFLPLVLHICKPKEIKEWKIKAFILMGDAQSIQKELNDSDSLSNYEMKDLIELFFNLTTHNDRYWHSFLNLNIQIINVLSINDFVLDVPKNALTKFLFDYWLTQKIGNHELEITLKISEKYGLSVLGYEISKYFGDDKKMNFFLSKMPKEGLLSSTHDFGSDLLQTPEVDRVSMLERDIKFLVNSGKRLDGLKLAYDLEKIDPDNQVAKYYIESQGYKKKEENLEPFSVEINKYEKNKRSSLEKSEYHREFLSIVKYYNRKYVQENYEDMMIGFNMLNLHPITIELSKLVNFNYLSDKEKVNFNYLKAETYLCMEDFYHLRDLCEDSLASLAMLDEERVSFIYLRAEAYFFLGKKEYALSIYKSLLKRNSDYRLTKQRIETIEKNK